MAQKTIILICFVLLVLQHNIGLSAQASRMLSLHPPPAIPTVLLRSPQPPSLDSSWYSINDEKGDEGDAFRPTSPGHSPGVGHQTPPKAP
ncbi:hypothetical protein VNO78_08642 [Psophocarpus tetragonolobus]|uniref:Encoded peptide n=1 Tax=Psophocarpus tetragonolobus TaxID=3891 RepID=A0AAN9XT57_PSOTE